MRVGFAGTPEFARVALAALLDSPHQVPLVLTQPDRPAGRGMKLQPSAVKQLALAHGLALAQPRSLRLDGKFPDDAAAAQTALQAAQLDALVVAAYGLILPPWLLAMPRHGCLNIHGSLLPRWRGAAPVQRAIEAGDSDTGVTIMQMDAGLDTGAMLLVERTAITAADTGISLLQRLADTGARCLLQSLVQLEQGTLQVRAQPAAGVTYASKIDKAEAAIDWAAPADVIERRLRAFDPFPGCTAAVGGQPVKLWRGRVVDGSSGGSGAAAAGQLLQAAASAGEGRLVVACGGGSALQLLQLQLPGGRRLSAAEFLQRLPLVAG